MRILQARFHFSPSDDSPLVVGYIFWDPADAMNLPRVQASYCPRRLEQPLEIVSTLQRFVQAAGGGRDAFDRLQKLRNRCWSFVDVSQPSWSARAGGSGSPAVSWTHQFDGLEGGVNSGAG